MHIITCQIVLFACTLELQCGSQVLHFTSPGLRVFTVVRLTIIAALITPPMSLNEEWLKSVYRSLQTPDEKAAFQAVQDAFKQGVNFFDVAPFYAAGKAEEVKTTQMQYECEIM